MEFWQNFDYIMLFKAFIVGGLICVIGLFLIDITKLTPARILVTFVTLGTILGGLGLYEYLVDFAGCGATVPLLGFGNNLAKGAIESVKENGINYAICCASSHFCSAERQFRFPLELGNQRPPTAQWTVTASGALILSKDGNGPFITHITSRKNC